MRSPLLAISAFFLFEVLLEMDAADFPVVKIQISGYLDAVDFFRHWACQTRSESKQRRTRDAVLVHPGVDEGAEAMLAQRDHLGDRLPFQWQISRLVATVIDRVRRTAIGRTISQNAG